jgi:uncharacterized cupredoxin-like copper-binding protein
MQTAASFDHIKYQVMWGVAGVFALAAFGAGLITMAALDARTPAIASSVDQSHANAPIQSAATGTLVTASVDDFSIKLDRNAVPAGKMTFRVKNLGPSFHEFVILKTDHAASKLPMVMEEGYMRAAEDTNGDMNVAELGGIKVGASRALTTTLKAGHYVIVCNLPMHYRSGMYAPFTVK